MPLRPRGPAVAFLLLLSPILASSLPPGCQDLYAVCQHPDACPILSQTAPPTFDAVYDTTAGRFTVHVVRDWAPPYADRFWQLTALEYMVGSPFYRVDYTSPAQAFVVQFGYRGDPASGWRGSGQGVRDCVCALVGCVNLRISVRCLGGIPVRRTSCVRICAG